MALLMAVGTNKKRGMGGSIWTFDVGKSSLGDWMDTVVKEEGCVEMVPDARGEN